MAKQPTPEDINVPAPNAARPVASYDVSAWGQGAQALAHGEQALGQGVEAVGQDLVAVQVEKDRRSIENAKTGLATDYINNRAKYEEDNGPDVKARWDADNQAALQNRSKGLPTSGPLAEHWQATTGEMTASEGLMSSKKQHAVSGDIAVSGITANLNTAITSYKRDPNDDADPTHTALLQGIHAQIDNAERDGHMTREQAEVAKQHTAKAIVGRHMSLWYQEDPEGFLKATGGWYPEAKLNRLGKTPYAAASVVAKAETGDPSLGYKALGNISPDTGGSRSYGFIGLNSGTGSAQAFTRQYGRQFGLTAPVGSVAYNAQWKAAAMDQTAAFRTAQLDWFNKNSLGQVTASLQQHGVPETVATDPRVMTFFADRHVQMGNIGAEGIDAAWKSSGGSVERFLRSMNQTDAANLPTNFRSAIASGVYGPQGHATRLNTRFAGAMAAGSTAPPVEPSSHLNEADEALGLNPQEAALYKRHLANLNGPGGVDNPDGTRSSLLQTTIEHDGKAYNIPTVWDGKKLTADEAWARAQKEGLDKFPSYKTEQEAEERYQQMHGFMDQDTAEYQAAVGHVRPQGADHPFLGLVDPADMTRYQAQARAVLNQRSADELRLQNQQMQDTVVGFHQRFEAVRRGDQGATLPPLSDILDNPILKNTPQGVALLEQRRAIEKQMGQEVTQAQADASRAARETYLSTIVAYQTGRAMDFELPTHQEIDADPNLTLADKTALHRDIGTMEASAQKQYAEGNAEQIRIAIEKAANGDGPMPSRESIESNPVLGSHTADLVHRWYEANKQDQSFRAALLKYGDPNGGPFGPHDKDDRTNIDKIFQLEAQRTGDPMKAAQAVVNRTRMMPQVLATHLRDMLVSQDQKSVGGALQVALNAYDTNPHIFAGVTGGEELQKAALGYKHDIDIGYTPEKAAQIYAQSTTPDFKEKRERFAKDEDVDKIIKANLAPGDIAGNFKDNWLPFMGPNAGLTVAQERQAFNDYVDVFRQNYMDGADPSSSGIAKAKALALAQLKNTYGVTRFAGTWGGSVTKYAIERAPAYAPMVAQYGADKVTDKMADDAIADIKAAKLPGIATLTRDKLVLMPTKGGQTHDAYGRGEAPPYQLSYRDDDGLLQVVPGAFVADAGKIAGWLADDVKARGDAAYQAAAPARAGANAALDARLIAQARLATRGTATDADRAADFKASIAATMATDHDQPPETAEARETRMRGNAAAWSEYRSSMASGLSAAHDTLLVKSQQASDARASADIRAKLDDLKLQEARVMRFPEGGAVRTTQMARIAQERGALEARRDALGSGAATTAVPALAPTTDHRAPDDFDAQARALDRREASLKRSGLGGAFLAAQSRRIADARAELARQRAAKFPDMQVP